MGLPYWRARGNWRIINDTLIVCFLCVWVFPFYYTTVHVNLIYLEDHTLQNMCIQDLHLDNRKLHCLD
ncbi:hypothetical protein Trydic_g21845 [Trypoxylus dichotomus]